LSPSRNVKTGEAILQTGQHEQQQPVQDQQATMLAPEVKSRPPKDAASLLAEYPPAIITKVLI
jgi:hypothetical protein